MISVLRNPRVYAFIASAVIIIAVLIAGYLFIVGQFDEETNKSARLSIEASNDDVVEIMGSTLTPEIKSLFEVAAAQSNPSAWTSLSSDAAYVSLDHAIQRLVENTQIVKIKLYDRNGTTVYSPDAEQLGVDYSSSEEFIHALRGQVESEIYSPESFETFTGKLKGAMIIGSYHPLKAADGAMIGVAEVYSNQTTEFKEISSRLHLTFKLFASGLLLITAFILTALGYFAFFKARDSC